MTWLQASPHLSQESTYPCAIELFAQNSRSLAESPRFFTLPTYVFGLSKDVVSTAWRYACVPASTASDKLFT